jgi:hypothetical protein
MSDNLVGYRGATTMDTGYFYCPYPFGSTEEQIRAINASLEASRLTEEQRAFQQKLAKSIKDTPKVPWKS